MKNLVDHKSVAIKCAINLYIDEHQKRWESNEINPLTVISLKIPKRSFFNFNIEIRKGQKDDRKAQGNPY